MEGRLGLKAGAVVTFAALIACTSAATSSFAAEPQAVTPVTPQSLESGRYIVLLNEEPAATYEGGEANLVATKSVAGDKLDANSDAVVEYTSYLAGRQDEVAAEAGVTPDNNITITLNAFTANLTAEQAAKLASSKDVKAVVPDEIRHPTAMPSTEFLGLEGPDGLWQSAFGGYENAGEGVVVGVVDTGIAPENPSFAGDPLGTAAGDAPYLEGNTVVFNKADGGQFRADRVAGDQWSNTNYNTKLIGAQYFYKGAEAAGFDFAYDILSPRDGDGHGSHTASTAAGNHGVDATVGGLDLGQISGVAPAAKIAAYKACYDGPDPAVTTDDICATSDLIGAIEAATKDGVDVINYSIGGGSATSTLAVDDIAFFNAASAGIFVAVSAGNSGPDYSTADHASPWYTTVAASTIPTYEGTAVLGDGAKYAGAALSVRTELTGPLVYAGDIPAAGAAAADAALCLPNTLDAAKAKDHIVICDRGNNARVEKSDTVKTAGGIGMILENVVVGSLDNDFHAVPTVHVADTARDAILAYVHSATNPTATLLPENTTGIETPVPQVAGFSSRGPMLADGSDILKPDVAAPGVNILAAEHNKQGEEPTWGLKSGTSMASPHVAGLGALYLSKHPNATPAEVKSALMTTAYDTKNADGSANTDPYEQGAGHVDPTKMFTPGLLYLNGPTDWVAFLVGKGLSDEAVDPIDGSDLNIASIAIGRLAGTQTITRTVTAQTAGTYTATVDVPGVNAVVEPSSITLAEGDSATFTVTFTNESAPTEQWATGFLTWTDGTIDVRSPIAVYPAAADAPADLSGTGTSGTIDYSIVSGVDGELPLDLSGLAPYVLNVEEGDPVPGHSGNQDSGDSNKDVYFEVQVPENSTLARFDLDSSDDTGADLDLSVYRMVSDSTYDVEYSSATGSADERVDLIDPQAGVYIVRVNVYATSAPMTWDLNTAFVGGEQEGQFTANPNPVVGAMSAEANIQLSWTGLANDAKYLGFVRYGGSVDGTKVTIDTGAAAPANTVTPTLAGTGIVGDTLTADPGQWDQENLTFTYEWLKDGAPIPAATGVNAAPDEAVASNTYVPTASDVGSKISVRVYATAEGNTNVGSAVTNEIEVTAVTPTTPAPTDSSTPTPTGSATTTPAPTLPITGSPDATAPLLIGFLIAAIGGAAVLIGRARRSEAK